jgi:hypothetical protein
MLGIQRCAHSVGENPLNCDTAIQCMTERSGPSQLEHGRRYVLGPRRMHINVCTQESARGVRSHFGRPASAAHVIRIGLALQLCEMALKCHLRRRMPMLGGRAEPILSGIMIFRHAVTSSIHDAGGKHPGQVALPGRLFE